MGTESKGKTQRGPEKGEERVGRETGERELETPEGYKGSTVEPTDLLLVLRLLMTSLKF